MNRESKRNQSREERRLARSEGEAEVAVPDERTSQRDEVDTKRKRTSPAQFLREVRGELKKVAWPNRQEVTSYTLVVLVTTAILTTIVFGLDWVIGKAVINLFG